MKDFTVKQKSYQKSDWIRYKRGKKILIILTNLNQDHNHQNVKKIFKKQKRMEIDVGHPN